MSESRGSRIVDSSAQSKEGNMSDLRNEFPLVAARCDELGIALKAEFGITELYQITGESPVWTRRQISQGKISAKKRVVTVVTKSGEQSKVEKWFIGISQAEARLNHISDKETNRQIARSDPKAYYGRGSMGPKAIANALSNLSEEQKEQLRKLLG
jgi:hypothetical protein